MSNLLHTIHVHVPEIQFDLISDQDAVLLWQDGVLIGLKNDSQENAILTQLKQRTSHIYVLYNDLVARGLIDFIDPNLQVIHFPELVALTQRFYPQKVWF